MITSNEFACREPLSDADFFRRTAAISLPLGILKSSPELMVSLAISGPSCSIWPISDVDMLLRFNPLTRLRVITTPSLLLVYA